MFRESNCLLPTGQSAPRHSRVERAARVNPGRSFDGALQAAQDVRRTGADIRKHQARRANPAFRERTGRPARRPRRRSRRRAREVLLCPITRTMFRDPVMVFESGHTYERSASLGALPAQRGQGPAHASRLSSTKVMTNWAVRNVVQDWLDKHPDVTPDGWDSRELLEPSKDDGTRTFDDEGDVGVLRTWRAMCPELQERWPED